MCTQALKEAKTSPVHRSCEQPMRLSPSTLRISSKLFILYTRVYRHDSSWPPLVVSFSAQGKFSKTIFSFSTTFTLALWHTLCLRNTNCHAKRSCRLYKKLKYVSRLEFLWDHVRRNEMEIPEFVYEHDRELEYRPMMDYGLESDHLRVYGEPSSMGPLSLYSMRCIA